jgi:hypothetical protein
MFYLGNNFYNIVHDITEILLTVVLDTITLTLQYSDHGNLDTVTCRSKD